MRRQLGSAAGFGAALLLAVPPLAAAQPPVPPAPTRFEAFADAHSLADVARTAHGLGLGDRLHLEGVELEPGSPPAGLDLERFAPFAADGRLVVHGPDGREEGPLPANAYFRGRVIGEPDSLAVLSVLEGGGVRGIVHRPGGFWQLGEGPPRADRSRGLVARPVAAPAKAAPAFECAANGLLAPSAVPASARSASAASEDAAVEPDAVAATSTAHTARVAVETDWELYQRFGSEVALADYVGDLFAYASSIYDREIATDLQVSHLSVWRTSADPYDHTQSCGLYEFGLYWNQNRTGVSRTIAHFVSGKTPSAGVAWLGVLCRGGFDLNIGGSCPGLPSSGSYGGAYGFTGGISGSFDPGSPSPVWDLVAVSHEIGHNFNSPHTHCYGGLGGSSSPVDQCYSAESGCYSGTTSLPGPAAAGSGTLMSYCHFKSGGLSNIGLTFGAGHPYGTLPQRVPDRMRAHVEARAAAYPACLAPSDGGGSGGPCDDLALPGQTVRTTELFEACDTLRAGRGGFSVVDPGYATLRGGTVVLESGFSVGAGARLRVETR